MENLSISDDKQIIITVLGASGDLAFKKTFPALFALFCNGHLPTQFHIVGYARSKFTDQDFKVRISSKFKLNGPKEHENIKPFLARCSYVS
jgi:glucose-6-phosphate 1-dehydrogenase